MDRAEPQLRDAMVVGLDSLLRSADSPTAHAQFLATVGRGMSGGPDALRGPNGEPTNESLLFQATFNVALQPVEFKASSIEAEFERLRAQTAVPPTNGGVGAIVHNARERFGNINMPLSQAVFHYNHLNNARQLESIYGVGFPGGQVHANHLNGVIDQLEQARGQRAPRPQQGFPPQQGQQQFPPQQGQQGQFQPQQGQQGQFQPAAQANHALGGQPPGNRKVWSGSNAGWATLGYLVTSAITLIVSAPAWAPLAFVAAAAPFIATKALNVRDNMAAKKAAGNVPQLTGPGGPAAHTAVQQHDPRQPARHRR